MFQETFEFRRISYTIRSEMRTTAAKFILMAACIAAPPIFVWSISYKEVADIATAWNYYFATAIFASFLAVACFEIRAAGLRDLKIWVKARRAGLIMAAVLGIFLQVGEPRMHKVLYDEDIMCGVARQMHDARQAAFPARAHIYDGRLVVLNSAVDKRPVFFPFVLCTIHDLAGYHKANVYILNGVCAAGLLFLLYLWARPLAGELGAVATLLLFCTLPLLAQNATCSGFEVINLLLIAALALAARRYLEKRGAGGMDLMIAIALMLSITRYESVLYLAVVAAVVLVKWIGEKRITLTFFAAVSPIFLISSFLSNRVFICNPDFFQNHNDAAFISFSNLSGNFFQAVYYLFDPPTGMLTNSLLLSAVGIVSIVLFLVSAMPRVARGRAIGDAGIVLSAVLVVALVNTLLGLMENWGQWSDPMAARFSLPLHLLMAMCFASALANTDFFKKYRAFAIAAVAVPAAWLVIFTSSQNGRHAMTSMMQSTHASAYFRDWADKNASERDLIVYESSVGFIVDGHPCVSFVSANMAPWKLKAVLGAGLYDHVYVMQRLRMDTATGKWVHYSNSVPLSDKVVLKAIAESRPQADFADRISELVDVTDCTPADADPARNMEHYREWLAHILP